MKQSRFSESQIIGMIKEQETGLPVSDLCRKHGLSPSAFYKLKAKYGGMDLSDAKRLKQLEDENGKLKSPLATISKRSITQSADIPLWVIKAPSRSRGRPTSWMRD